MSNITDRLMSSFVQGYGMHVGQKYGLPAVDNLENKIVETTKKVDAYNKGKAQSFSSQDMAEGRLTNLEAGLIYTGLGMSLTGNLPATLAITGTGTVLHASRKIADMINGNTVQKKEVEEQLAKEELIKKMQSGSKKIKKAQRAPVDIKKQDKPTLNDSGCKIY